MTPRTIAAALADPRRARAALGRLRHANFGDRRIGLLASGAEGDAVFESFKELEGNKSAEGAAVGAASGAGVGVAWSLAVVAGSLPGLGPVIAGGVLSALVVGGVGAATAGGLAGALLGLGMADHDAALCEGEVARGRCVVVVCARDDEEAERARQILASHDGHRPAAA